MPLAVNDVPETGLLRDLVADGSVRAATAKLAGLRDLPRLEASFDVTQHGRGGLRVSGRLRATVGQTCVVTLDPIENEIDEPIDLVFAPADTSARRRRRRPAADDDDGPEPLVGGTIDLGTIATEFLFWRSIHIPVSLGRCSSRPSPANRRPILSRRLRP